MRSLSEFRTYLTNSGTMSKLDKLRIDEMGPEEISGDYMINGDILDPFLVSEQLSEFLGLKLVTNVSNIVLSDKVYEIDLWGAKELNLVFVRDDYEGGKEQILVSNPFDERVKSYLKKWGDSNSEIKIANKTVISVIYDRYSGLVNDILKGVISIYTRDEVEILLRRILSDAVKKRASDIRIMSTGTSGVITFRIDGDVINYDNISMSAVERLYSMVISDKYTTLNNYNENKPRVGYMRVSFSGEAYEMRVNIIPAITGIDVNMRFMYKENIDFEKLGASSAHSKIIFEEVRKSKGIILFTGPTGSGKSTTLYSLLEIIKDRQTICTVEDPIEHKIGGIAQLNISDSLTYEEAIQSFLRHDPDVIVVGEVRSQSVAKNTFIAAETGHFIMSSMHGGDAINIIGRLRGLGVSNIDIVDSLSTIVSQRLAKRVCQYCKGEGCSICGGTGNKGRVLVSEILLIDENIKRGILNGEGIFALKERLDENNYFSAKKELRRQVEAGYISEDVANQFIIEEELE